MARLRTHNRRWRRRVAEEAQLAATWNDFARWGPRANIRLDFSAFVAGMEGLGYYATALGPGAPDGFFADGTAYDLKTHLLPEGRLYLNGRDAGAVTDAKITFDSPDCPGHSKPMKG